MSSVCDGLNDHHPPRTKIPNLLDTALVIRVEHLTKRYGDILAVDDLSFSLQPGIVTGFLGPNGAGKSTTMRMILGLDRPTSGTATIGGQPFAESPWPLRKVGALLDAMAMNKNLSNKANLRILASTKSSRSSVSPKPQTARRGRALLGWASGWASPRRCSATLR